MMFGFQLLYAQNDFTAKEFTTSSNDILKYRELLPDNYNPEKQYPLVLFLHGAGERGNDNQAQLRHGSMMFTNPVNQEKYPAIVLFPQCPASSTWPFEKAPEGSWNNFPKNDPISTPLNAVKELLDQYLEMKSVDKKRIYILGISMGGMGTFDMVCRYPDIFAAAIPICGGVATERLVKAKDVKFRIYHGDADMVVSVHNSRNAYKELKKDGAKVEYIEFPGCNHDSWNPAFNRSDFLEWLFKQKK
jgi:predicted peptidase